METMTSHRSGTNTPHILSTANMANIVKGLPARAQFAIKSLSKLEVGTLTLHMPDKRVVTIKGKTPGPDATIILHNWNILHKALTSSTIGVAEAYMDGDWESPDVTTFLELLVYNQTIGDTISKRARGLIKTVERFRHWLRSNTRAQAKKNISAHYDLGNDFYSQWLDETMTYSSALYETGTCRSCRRSER
jgi:cyclopropane-fatty-acyl-phospholipid synthase